MKISISKTLIYIIISLYAIVLIFLIRKSELNTTSVRDISILTSSTFTLIIALLLFDRFDYRKKIYEKKLQIVIELIEFLKKTRLQISQKSKEKEILYVGGLIVDRNLISNFKKGELDFNSKIIFDINDVHKYFEEIEIYKVNPFMPKSIAKSLEFVGIQPLYGKPEIDEEYISNFTKISINSKQDFLKIEGCSKPEKEISLTEFLDSYLKTLNEIESWINMHSNFKSELNI